MLFTSHGKYTAHPGSHRKIMDRKKERGSAFVGVQIGFIVLCVNSLLNLKYRSRNLKGKKSKNNRPKWLVMESNRNL